MGKRSGMPETPEAAAKLSVDEFGRWIKFLEYRFQNVGNAGLKKSAFKGLIWLEAQREQVHAIPAPMRRLPARKPN